MISFTAKPILFKIFGIKIFSFGFFLAFAFLISLFLAQKNADEKNKKHITNLWIFIAFFALIFAKIAYFVFYGGNITSFIHEYEGGFLSIGAILGGLLGAFVYAKIAKINFLNIMNFSSIYLVLASAIGRIGCFFRGCCFGLPTKMPWGIIYKGESLASQAGLHVALHPTQLYHSLADFAIFFFLLTRKNKSKNLFLFLFLYSTQRIIIDFFRYYEQSYYALGLTITQLFFIFVFIIAGIFILKKIRKK